MSFWTKLFDVSEISLRLFSAVFGSLSIIIVYLVAKELSNNKIALLSSFIFSLSMANIQYSQEARLYSLLVFISLSSVYFFIKSNCKRYL
ncbi:MAG: glycosyltransferase family 39 protein, partial [Proteobacteria bacterium]|nr:glycosyltransferase family 39 protein [Pseudomonadota bacterium]